jgi:hypothetical protein
MQAWYWTGSEVLVLCPHLLGSLALVYFVWTLTLASSSFEDEEDAVADEPDPGQGHQPGPGLQGGVGAAER